MATPRGQTLQQRFGFSDSDLKTQTHDDLMFWLDNNIKMILDSVFVPGSSFGPESIEDNIKRAKQELRKWGVSEEWNPPLSPPCPGILGFQTIWEHPIQNNNYIVGFLDLIARVNIPSLGMVDIKRTWDHKANGWVTEKMPEWVIWETRWTVGFEVKTSIPSIGELLRQLRMYKAYFEHQIYVVSHDTRAKEILVSQGFGFISPDDFEYNINEKEKRR